LIFSQHKTCCEPFDPGSVGPETRLQFEQGRNVIYPVGFIDMGFTLKICFSVLQS
jgi:hypothetical protein